MLIWLSGIDNTKRGAERELRPRDDGAVHARRLRRVRLPVLGGRRPRAGAGADRLDRRLGRRRRLRQLPLRRRAPRRAARRRSSARPATFDWTDSCRLCVAPRGPQDLLRQQALELLHPGAAVGEDAQGAGARSTSSASYAIRPVRRGDPHAPGPSTAARRWSSRRSSTSPACCAPAAAACSSDWAWISELAGQRLFRPPNVSGWDDARWLDTSTFRGRWIAANEIAGYDAIDDEAAYDAAEAPKAGGAAGRCSSGATRCSATTTRKGLERYAGAVAPRRDRRLAAGDLPRCCARTRCGC